MNGATNQNPKLRMDLKVFRQEKEGDLTRFVIKDLAADKFFRVSEYEYRLLKTLDGTVSLQEAVEKLKSQGYFYEIADANLVLSKAEQLGLLLNTRFGTSEFLISAKKRMDEQKRTRQISGIYFRYIPLFNPDKFLERTIWVFDLLVNKYTATFMLLILPVALYFIVTGMQNFKNVYLFFFNFNNLLILWAAIALSKLIHEFAHAYTAKHYGIRVPEMGIGILMFFPVLYSNVTDAWQLGDRRQRMAIAGAGIISEAVIAILATFVWTFTKPGMINSLAFYMMAMSFVSTLLFNGNPLMKFDGYFVLVDYLQLPNLWAKSMKYVKHLWMEKVLGVANYPDPSNTDRERKIFGVYGVSLFAYRILLYTGIVINVYWQFDKLLGILLGVVAFFLFIVKPVYTGCKTLYAKRGEIKIKRKGGLVFLGIMAILVVVLFIPLSSMSIFPCYMASNQVQKLSVPLLTMVREVHIEQGSEVKKGQVLYELDPTQLELLFRQKHLQRSIIKAEVQLLLLDEEHKGKAPAKEAELKQVDNEIHRIEEDLRIARTGNIAPFDGVVTMLDYRMQPGYKPQEGAIVGEIKSVTDGVIHALVPAINIDRVRVGMAAEIWFPIGTGFFIYGKVDEVSPFSEKDLRDSPFSSRFGGELATEALSESHKDAPLEAVYRCAVNFSNNRKEVPLGMTGRMAVKAPPQSLFMKFVNQIFNVFNRESFF